MLAKPLTWMAFACGLLDPSVRSVAYNQLRLVQSARKKANIRDLLAEANILEKAQVCLCDLPFSISISLSLFSCLSEIDLLGLSGSQPPLQ
jgi:hypothetical protein